MEDKPKVKRKKPKQVSLELPRKPDGSRDRKYFYGHTRAEAIAQRKKYQEFLERGSAVDPNITVAEWVEIVKDTYRTNINPLYIRDDNIPYDRLVKEIGTKKVVDIREAHLQKALNKVNGMSFSTITKYETVIKKVFSKARKNRIITDDPSEDLFRPQYTKGTHRCLEAWEVEMILSNWNNKDARVGIWVMLMLLCGLRRGEMIALRWENVNMQSRRITVCETAVILTNQSVIENRTKSKAGGRILPIPRALYEALDTIPQEQRSGFVCVSAKGKQLSEKAVKCGIDQFCLVMTRLINNEPTKMKRKWKKKVEKEMSANKLEDVGEETSETTRIIFEFRAHDLRHTYATALHDAGVPAPAAQYFLGHGTLRMTLELYTHFSKESENTSREKLMILFDNWLNKRLIGMDNTTQDLSVDYPQNGANFDIGMENGWTSF